MDWRCWTLLAGIGIAIAVIVFLVLRNDQLSERIHALTVARDQALTKAEANGDERDRLKRELRATEAAFAQETGELRTRLQRSREALAARPRPRTLDDCMVGLGVRDRHIKLLDEALELSDMRHTEEMAEAKAIILAGDRALSAYRTVVHYDTQRFRLMKKQVRRQKLKTAGWVIGSLIVGGLGGYGVAAL